MNSRGGFNLSLVHFSFADQQNDPSASYSFFADSALLLNEQTQDSPIRANTFISEKTSSNLKKSKDYCAEKGESSMFKNPVVKFIAMFVIGFVMMVAVQWLVSIIKSTPFQMNWVYNIAMGIFIAVMELLIPADKRKENRKKLMDSFKK